MNAGVHLLPTTMSQEYLVLYEPFSSAQQPAGALDFDSWTGQP